VATTHSSHDSTAATARRQDLVTRDLVAGNLFTGNPFTGNLVDEITG
jgi:hypothetical protein